MKKICLFILAFLVASLVLAQTFQAPITDTHWQVIESPLSCKLSQKIPDFGSAEFSQQTGREFSVSFITTSQPAVQNNLSFEIAEAAWQNKEDRLHLVSVPTDLNQKEFSLKGNFAKQIYTHIVEGKVPVIRYNSQYIGSEISVLMSTIHFKESQQAFQQCIENLHPDTFESIRKLTIHFEIEKYELSSGAKKALKRLADYVNVDKAVTHVVISGHTDNHGRKRLNEPLSEARAFAVKNYLVGQCNVAENLVITTSHLEKQPIATNTTQAGRAYNRRAEIEVFR